MKKNNHKSEYRVINSTYHGKEKRTIVIKVSRSQI